MYAAPARLTQRGGGINCIYREPMIRYSVLDLAPITQGATLRPRCATRATSRSAAATQTIRVGAGGIMLPNHAPLIIAEQFGTLASLFPGRIDLGLGRAPGTDHATARALRRTLASQPDAFPQDVLELVSYEIVAEVRV